MSISKAEDTSKFLPVGTKVQRTGIGFYSTNGPLTGTIQGYGWMPESKCHVVWVQTNEMFKGMISGYTHSSVVDWPDAWVAVGQTSESTDGAWNYEEMMKQAAITSKYNKFAAAYGLSQSLKDAYVEKIKKLYNSPSAAASSYVESDDDCLFGDDAGEGGDE